MTTVAARGGHGWLKRMWNQNPEVFGSCIMGLIGVGLIGFANYYYYYVVDGNNRKYRTYYTVYRHDDPRVEKLKLTTELTSKP